MAVSSEPGFRPPDPFIGVPQLGLQFQRNISGMSANAVEVAGLRKVFRTKMGREIVALDRVDFTVQPGELFGLLGPNGAGKTTTVKILLGLTRPTAGSARIEGVDVERPQSRLSVGYLPEGHRFPGYLTAKETLRVFGRMSGLDPKEVDTRAFPLLERLGIDKWADVRVKKFSKGMTQRLGLVSALLHDPRVVLLDEPTDGVDPVGRREIRDLLREEASRGRAIVVNSHLLSEIELTCDRVAVLRRGQIAALGSVEELTRRESRYRLVVDGGTEIVAAALARSGVAVESVNGSIHVSVRDLDELNAMIDSVRQGGTRIAELTPLRSTLEDVFVDLIRTDGGHVPVGGEELR